MKVCIIGCGLIGRKRALALQNDDILVACCDTNKEIGKKFSEDFKCKFYSKYVDLLANCDCDIVIISVINKYAEKIACFSLNMKKHVLIEKPMGINQKESFFTFSLESFHSKDVRPQKPFRDFNGDIIWAIFFYGKEF